jgi:hypothetical protein
VEADKRGYKTSILRHRLARIIMGIDIFLLVALYVIFIFSDLTDDIAFVLDAGQLFEHYPGP